MAEIDWCGWEFKVDWAAELAMRAEHSCSSAPTIDRKRRFGCPLDEDRNYESYEARVGCQWVGRSTVRSSFVVIAGRRVSTSLR